MSSIKRIFCFSLVGLVFIAVPVHFWMADPHGVMRQVFFIQAPLSKLAQQCSPNSPDWLGRISLTGIEQLKSLSTQVAFVDKNGNLSHCETGWKSAMFFSGRVDANTRFRYGSLTKPVTASAIIVLVNKGKLSYQSGLADSLGLDVAPSVNQGLSGVTIEDLLLHRSGIQGQIFLNREKPQCPGDLGPYMAEGKVKRNGEFEYSNMGYCLLGEVIANKTGQPYKQAVDRLFSLSERDIRFVDYESGMDEVRRDFRFNDFYGVNNKGRFDYEAVAATAGLSGSASAYGRLIKDMIHQTGGENLAGFDEGCNDNSLKACYGYAFYSYSYIDGQRVFVKEGYMPGASGVAVVNGKGEVFVWLGNSDTENAVSGIRMSRFLGQLMETEF